VLTFDRDLIAAQVDVRVREMPDDGLRFFALQTNFDGAWAHGGLQGDQEANWGGLSRADSYDYEGNELHTLDLIQNSETRLLPVTWQLGRWYRYRIERGPREVLPPGAYSIQGGGDGTPIVVDHEREMTRWDFTIEDLDTSELVYEAWLHTAADVFTSVTYWTETGYGVTCNDRLTVDWSDPLVTSASAGGPQLPQRIAKSIDNSTCPAACTSDMDAADHGGEWGTTQVYGRARAESSTTGQVLWLRAR
jgi:hypothetical protein